MLIIIVGGGIFGLYSAAELSKKGYDVKLFEQGMELGSGATKVNQARLHLGYHYPRSNKTALQCIKGFDKFIQRFPESINKDFNQYYAIAKDNSKVDSVQYINFCSSLGLPFQKVNLDKSILNPDSVQLNILAKEYSFDWRKIVDKLTKEVLENGGKIYLGHKLIKADRTTRSIIFETPHGLRDFFYEIVINATYSNLNGINKIFGTKEIPMEYELCEMAIVKVPEKFKKIGITIMDGDFTSIMPFGLSGYHSISNVRRTPHERSLKGMPEFSCNKENTICSKENLNICLNCPFKPKSWFDSMSYFAKKYLPWIDNVKYIESLFAVKAIPSNVDQTDERPSSVIEDVDLKGYYSIFSGKVDTVIDIVEDLIERIEVNNHDI